MDPDLLLLESWRGGDRQAGEALFGRHFADIYRFFEHKVGADADELTQRTFLACVAAREQFRGHSSFRTYMFAIARNQLYAFLRNRKRDAVVSFDVTSLAEIVSSPSSRLGRKQEVGQLRDALAELPAEQQLLLELHYWHELDAAALAEVFDAAPGAIRVRLLRARKALREQMGRLGPEAMTAAAGDPMTTSLQEPDLDEP